MGKVLAKSENATVKEVTRGIIANNLAGVLQLLEIKIESLRDQLLKDTYMENVDLAQLAKIKEKNPLAEEVFAFSPEGKLLWPTGNEAITFYFKYSKVILDKQFIFENSENFFQIPENSNDTDNTETTEEISNEARTKQSIAQLPDSGWHPWFDGPGLRLIFWQKTKNNEIIGIILSRARTLADIIAILPEDNDQSSSNDKKPPFQYALLNGLEQPIYQWGEKSEIENAPPFFSRNLAAPLSNWKIVCYCPEDYFKNSSRLWFYNTTAIVISLTIFFIAIAAILYREMRKTIREASQRVNFVSQVSHELKTPLTNIRMYAELLQESIADEDERLANFANIISDESRRLTRLIANILTFSRKQKNKLTLKTGMHNPDIIIRKVLSNHKPSLQQLGIAPTLKLNANQDFELDQDKFEQIIGNLINNVEKYAASGKVIEIASKIQNSQLEVIVSDNGPGIEESYYEKIFQPFFRISDKASDGTAGTGIGLSIARDLARLHEGDLVILKSDKGAKFKLVI